GAPAADAMADENASATQASAGANAARAPPGLGFTAADCAAALASSSSENAGSGSVRRERIRQQGVEGEPSGPVDLLRAQGGRVPVVGKHPPAARAVAVLPGMVAGDDAEVLVLVAQASHRIAEPVRIQVERVVGGHHDDVAELVWRLGGGEGDHLAELSAEGGDERMHQRVLPAHGLDVEHEDAARGETSLGCGERLARHEVEGDGGAAEGVEEHDIVRLTRALQVLTRLGDHDVRLKGLETEELGSKARHGRIDLDRFHLPATS